MESKEIKQFREQFREAILRKAVRKAGSAVKKHPGVVAGAAIGPGLTAALALSSTRNSLKYNKPERARKRHSRASKTKRNLGIEKRYEY